MERILLVMCCGKAVPTKDCLPLQIWKSYTSSSRRSKNAHNDVQYELVQTLLSNEENIQIQSKATQVIKSKDWMYIVHSFASLQMMGGRSLTFGKEKA